MLRLHIENFAATLLYEVMMTFYLRSAHEFNDAARSLFHNHGVFLIEENKNEDVNLLHSRRRTACKLTFSCRHKLRFDRSVLKILSS